MAAAIHALGDPRFDGVFAGSGQGAGQTRTGKRPFELEKSFWMAPATQRFYESLTPGQKEALAKSADAYLDYIKAGMRVKDTAELDSNSRDVVQATLDWLKGKISR